MVKQSRGRRNKNRMPNSAAFVTSGQQELTQLTIGTPSGTFVGAQIPLIPTFEPTSRLGVLALQFSQYSIIGSSVQFVSQTTTSTSGRLALAWTFDTIDSDPVNVHQILQISRAKTGVLWKNHSSKMSRNSPEKRRFPVIDSALYVNLSSQDKQIYTPASIIYGTDGSAQSGLLVGTLIWHYKIAFYNPNVQTGVVGFRNLMTFSVVPSPAMLNAPASLVDEEEQEQGVLSDSTD